MTELVILRGLPASGKTTWARHWVANDLARWARVSRDDLRAQLFGATEGDAYRAYFDLDGLAARERAVTAAEDAMVRGLLEAERSVVVDNTHLRVRYVRHWVEVATEYGAHARIHDFFDVPLDECLRRDAARGDRVGRGVILEMHRKFGPRFARDEAQAAVDSTLYGDGAWRYVPDEDLPRAWIVDVDGTLALKGERSPYDLTSVRSDTVNGPVAMVVASLDHAKFHVIVVSGREGTEQCRADTEEWLMEHRIPFDELVMRAEGDTRDDATVKMEILRDQIAPAFQVVGVLDDRNRVVRMWRGLGLACLQVAPGAF